MRIPIDRENHQPLYQQIETFLRTNIMSGQLPAETRLPASRQLASELGVSRMTVERAYAELEADGLLYAKMGSGTYTLSPPSVSTATNGKSNLSFPRWQQTLSDEDVHAFGIPPQKIESPQINFGNGTGDSSLFRVDEFRRLLQQIMREKGIQALDYGDPRGYAPLRHTVAQVLTSQGLQANPDHILITSGSQQSLSLVTQLLLQPGDRVLVEKPTYAVALELFRRLKLEPIAIPMDEDGLCIDQAERLIQQHQPKLLYTMPTFHNPTGVCMSTARRRQLIALAEQYNMPILEDDFVGDLRYEGRAQSTLKALDTIGNVIYISTFSKMLMPGLRTGFLLADGPIYEQLVSFKYVNDLASSSLIQHALAAYISIGRYQTHLNRSRRIYRKRRNTMLAAIQQYLPDTVDYTIPSGGLFIWLRLPNNLLAEQLRSAASRQGITLATGNDFFVDPVEGEHYCRLNFASVPPDPIEAGIAYLGQVIANF